MKYNFKFEDGTLLTDVCNVLPKGIIVDSIDAITANEKNLAAYRAAYQLAQDEALQGIAKWFKAWRHTDAAKAIREHTANFTRVFSSPTTEDANYYNGIRAHMEESVWSVVSLTTPAKWANAIEWAQKVADGKVCKNLSGDASKLTKAEAMERAKVCVTKCMNTDLEDVAMDIWFNCKNGKFEGLIELEVKLAKLQAMTETETETSK